MVTVGSFTNLAAWFAFMLENWNGLWTCIGCVTVSSGLHLKLPFHAAQKCMLVDRMFHIIGPRGLMLYALIVRNDIMSS